jgi:hypothetical protein
MIHGSQPLLFFRPQSGATTSQIRFQLTDGSNEFGITHFGSRLTLGRIVGTTVANDLIVAGDGNIGVGTTTPNAKLHVNTNMMIGPGTPTSGYALSVNGKVISEEVRGLWPRRAWLERAGVLPPRSSSPLRLGPLGSGKKGSEPVAIRLLECTLEELGPIELVLVGSRSSQAYRLWKALLDRYHYLGAGPLCGAQLRYLVRCPQGWIGALAFSAAARRQQEAADDARQLDFDWHGT